MVEGLLYIDLNKDLCLAEPCQCFLNERQGISILLRDLIELLIINAEVQATAIWFGSKEDGSCLKGRARGYKALSQVVRHILPAGLKLLKSHFV